MKEMLIVKTGSTFPSLREIRGDFDEWILRQMRVQGVNDARVVRVSDGETLPPPQEFAGIVVTGSSAMVTEHSEWMERTAEWLAEACRLECPLLGICFGHQLLAYALDGTVGANPLGPEYGTVVVTPNVFGEEDPLIGIFQGPFKAYMCHRQSVLTLPRGAVPLASTRGEANAAFSYHSAAWGVQFHPEFDSRIMKVYILRNKALFEQYKLSISDAFASCIETGAGYGVFQRFLHVIRDRG